MQIFDLVWAFSMLVSSEVSRAHTKLFDEDGIQSNFDEDILRWFYYLDDYQLHPEETFFNVMCLLERFLVNSDTILTASNVRVLVVLSISLYNKWISDIPLGNDFWKKQLNCPTEKMFQRELLFFYYLDYDVRIKNADFERVRKKIYATFLNQMCQYTDIVLSDNVDEGCNTVQDSLLCDEVMIF